MVNVNAEGDDVIQAHYAFVLPPDYEYYIQVNLNQQIILYLSIMFIMQRHYSILSKI